MLHKTQAIVVRSTKYDDSALVVQAYTLLFGMRTYMVRGIRRRKGRGMPAALFQPLSLLDMLVYEKPNRGMQHIKEVKPAHHYVSLPYVMEKSSLLVFINELVYKCIKEESDNPTLFAFLYDSLVYLDSADQGLALFHIRFMLQFSRYLGFYPANNYHPQQRPYFDMAEGQFVQRLPGVQQQIEPPLSALFSQLIAAPDYEHAMVVPKVQRLALLRKCISYYACHVPHFNEMQSLEVLLSIYR